jgi:hypothetical protein
MSDGEEEGDEIFLSLSSHSYVTAGDHIRTSSRDREAAWSRIEYFLL